jgi:hypothetical protein
MLSDDYAFQKAQYLRKHQRNLKDKKEKKQYKGR